MSVFRDPRSPYWQYKFQIGGRRFYGSTKARTDTARRRPEGVA